MDNQEKLDLIGEATKDGLEGTLSPGATLLVIHSILWPTQISEDDLDWAKKEIAKIRAPLKLVHDKSG
jgi:hypothetical protein